MMSVRSVLQQLRNEGVVGRELQKVLRDREVNLKKMPITQVCFMYNLLILDGFNSCN